MTPEPEAMLLNKFAAADISVKYNRHQIPEAYFSGGLNGSLH
jgi:hypothetical protein